VCGTAITPATAITRRSCSISSATLESSALRPGNVHNADGWDGALKPVVVRYRGKVSRIYFRAARGAASRLHPPSVLQKGRKSANIHACSGVIRRIPVSSSAPQRCLKSVPLWRMIMLPASSAPTRRSLLATAAAVGAVGSILRATPKLRPDSCG
jgi:hypothetical protein